MEIIMNKGKLQQPDRLHKTGFWVCAALFLIGCVAGVICSAALPPDTPVNDFITSTAAIEGRSFAERFLSSLLTSGKFHVLVLFFSFSAFGIVAVPAVSALRGFLLCFAASSVIRCNGASFIPRALLMFAPEALLAIPGLFLLSAYALVSSSVLLRVCLPGSIAPAKPFNGVFVKRAMLVFALLCLSALVDAITAPWLAAYFVK